MGMHSGPCLKRKDHVRRVLKKSPHDWGRDGPQSVLCRVLPARMGRAPGGRAISKNGSSWLGLPAAAAVRVHTSVRLVVLCSLG